jgi:hypothetical protein
VCEQAGRHGDSGHDGHVDRERGDATARRGGRSHELGAETRSGLVGDDGRGCARGGILVARRVVRAGRGRRIDERRRAQRRSRRRPSGTSAMTVAALATPRGLNLPICGFWASPQ